MGAAMTRFERAWAFLVTISFACHQLATAGRLQELKELSLSSQTAIVELRQCRTGEASDLYEITTPDGRYTITVERPEDGVLELRINEPQDGEQPAAPGGIRWPGEGREIFNTDFVL